MQDCYASVELINGNDLVLQRKAIIQSKEVRYAAVNMCVVETIHLLCIDEEINNQLRLPVVDSKLFWMPDGTTKVYDIVAPVEIRFANRRSTTQAIVLPGNTHPILGRLFVGYGCPD